MFDIRKAAEEMIKRPEVRKAVNDAIDAKFTETFETLMGPMKGFMNTKPDEKMLKEQRDKLWAHADAWTLISIYAPEYDKKLWDMMAEADEEELRAEMKAQLKKHGLSD